nr:retinol-binding protein pinta-like [Onthophagus taurus]
MSVRPLSRELQAKAIADLNEDPKRIDDDIQALREWLEKQPHLTPKMEKQFLLSFLRGCKFSLEKAKRKLENLYTMKTMLKELFAVRDPFSPEIQELLKLGIFLPLIKTESADSPRVIIVRHADPVIHKGKDVCKVHGMMSDILINEDDQSLIAGAVFLQDMSGFSAADMIHADLPLTKKVMTFFEGAYPQRPQVMHFINLPSIFESAFSMIKPFMKEEMLKRFVIHKTTNMDEIFKHIPKSILPNEYGGDGGPIQDLIDYWKIKVDSYAEWFKEDAKYKSDESKRIGKPKTESDLFGIEGSFRKLDVD